MTEESWRSNTMIPRNLKGPMRVIHSALQAGEKAVLLLQDDRHGAGDHASVVTEEEAAHGCETSQQVDGTRLSTGHLGWQQFVLRL